MDSLSGDRGSPARPTAVLFDLDGTITDSAPAITGAIAHTLRSFGHPPGDSDDLTAFVGPPIRSGFAQFTRAPAAELDAMVATFRRHYAATMLNVPLYPGMTDLLRSLTRSGTALGIATSKPRPIAVRIIDHLGLASSFVVVCGAPDDRAAPSKAGIIGEALAALCRAGADTSRVMMVGDRHHDVEGARANSIDAVFVEWGYGGAGEEGDAPRCTSVAALASLLGVSPSGCPAPPPITQHAKSG